MITRPIGDSGLSFSAIGLGCAAMGRDPRLWGAVDDNESIGAIHAALDLGVNWLDVAPAHGGGHAEQIVGKAIQGRRDQIHLVSRCGTPLHDAPASGRSLRPESIRREIVASLRRLRTEHIDLLICQHPDPETPLADTLGTLSELRDQGKVRAIGAAAFSCDQLLGWIDLAPLHAICPQLNLLEREPLHDLVPFAAEHGAAVLACGPLCRGMLGGRYDASSRFSDVRARDKRFNPPRFAINLEAVEAFKALAARRERPVAQLAVAWLLAQPGITGVCCGAKRASQIRELVGAVDWSLAESEHEAIRRALATLDEKRSRLY
ncbi:MAG: aldo/keto reductase [Phycisphaerae bacterium]|nr:aldo/keto reductase [Phycisphaerae bacterium]NUQ46825.1 aldo/keto reductase [Phycisphaerae bacterium]